MDRAEYILTVEPLFSGHLLSGHPLSGHPLSGQLSKSRNFCELNAVNITPIQRPRPPFGRPGNGSSIVVTPKATTKNLMHVVWEKLIIDKPTKTKVTTDKNVQTKFYNRLYLSFHRHQEVALTSFTL